MRPGTYDPAVLLRLLRSDLRDSSRAAAGKYPHLADAALVQHLQDKIEQLLSRHPELST